MLLCRLIGFKVTIEHTEKGAPFIPELPNLYISISHCRTAVAVAACEGRRVGIDIESRRKVSPSLIERVCTSDETATIQSSDDLTMAFLRLWTRKEAVLKMRGTGIQGFGSMVEALKTTDCTVTELDCRQNDTVAALATAL